MGTILFQVEAKGASVMCSYNSINGIASCGNKWLLQDILRDEWGHEGHVVSDCGTCARSANPRFTFSSDHCERRCSGSRLSAAQ